MATTSFFCSSLKFPASDIQSASIPSPKFSSLNNPFLRIKIPSRNYTPLVSLQLANSSSDSTVTVAENDSPAESSSKSEGGVILDEEDEKALAKIGARVRVKVPLKVYHVPKVPEIELTGKTGVIKQYVVIHKGNKISANLPFKVEFVEENIEGRSGPLKFSAHLREDEFDYLD